VSATNEIGEAVDKTGQAISGSDLVTSGHKKVGEKDQEGRLRIQEERLQQVR